jgi:hypothetical protein
MKIVSPVGIPEPERPAGTESLEAFDHRPIGVVQLDFRNADVFVDRMLEHLEHDFPHLKVQRVLKHEHSKPLAPGVLAELAGAQAVFTAYGH